MYKISSEKLRLSYVATIIECKKHINNLFRIHTFPENDIVQRPHPFTVYFKALIKRLDLILCLSIQTLPSL